MELKKVQVSIVKQNRKVANLIIENKVVDTIRYNGNEKLLIVENDYSFFKTIDELIKAYESSFDLAIVEDNPQTEWIVEQKCFDSDRLCVIGKFINLDTDYLSSYELEEMWNLINYNSSQPKQAIIEGSEIYDKGFVSSSLKHLLFVPTEKARGCANCDIFIRKHYDTENGFFISHSKGSKDKWVYGSRKEAIHMVNKKPWE